MNPPRRRAFWWQAARNAYALATNFADNAARIVFVVALFGLSIVGAVIATIRGGPVWLAPLIVAVLVLGLLAEGAYETWRSLAEQVSRDEPQPVLRVGDSLEEDSMTACFRLRLWNDHEPRCRPRVTVDRAIDQEGNSLFTAVPLELEWTHHPHVRPDLGPQDRGGETVAVVFLAPFPLVPGAYTWAYLYGQNHQQVLGADPIEALKEGSSFVIDISAYIPEFNSEPIRRQLTFSYDPNRPLLFRTQMVTLS